MDSHRYSAAHFEDPARRWGLRLICIDRPGRGLSDPVIVNPTKPAESTAEGEGGGEGGDAGSQADACEAVEAAVVDTVKQVNKIVETGMKVPACTQGQGQGDGEGEEVFMCSGGVFWIGGTYDDILYTRLLQQREREDTLLSTAVMIR